MKGRRRDSYHLPLPPVNSTASSHPAAAIGATHTKCGSAGATTIEHPSGLRAANLHSLHNGSLSDYQPADGVGSSATHQYAPGLNSGIVSVKTEGTSTPQSNGGGSCGHRSLSPDAAPAGRLSVANCQSGLVDSSSVPQRAGGDTRNHATGAVSQLYSQHQQSDGSRHDRPSRNLLHTTNSEEVAGENHLTSIVPHFGGMKADGAHDPIYGWPVTDDGRANGLGPTGAWMFDAYGGSGGPSSGCGAADSITAATAGVMNLPFDLSSCLPLGGSDEAAGSSSTTATPTGRSLVGGRAGEAREAHRHHQSADALTDTLGRSGQLTNRGADNCWNPSAALQQLSASSVVGPGLGGPVGGSQYGSCPGGPEDGLKMDDSAGGNMFGNHRHSLGGSDGFSLYGTTGDSLLSAAAGHYNTSVSSSATDPLSHLSGFSSDAQGSALAGPGLGAPGNGFDGSAFDSANTTGSGSVPGGPGGSAATRRHTVGCDGSAGGGTKRRARRTSGSVSAATARYSSVATDGSSSGRAGPAVPWGGGAGGGTGSSATRRSVGSVNKSYSSSLSRFTLPDENGKRKIRHDIMSIAESLPALPGLYFDKKQKGFRVRYQNVYVGWVALSRFPSIEEAYISARDIWENAKHHAEKFQSPHAAIMASFPLQKEAQASGKNRGGRPRTVTTLPQNPADWISGAFLHSHTPTGVGTHWAQPTATSSLTTRHDLTGVSHQAAANAPDASYWNNQQLCLPDTSDSVTTYPNSNYGTMNVYGDTASGPATVSSGTAGTGDHPTVSSSPSSMATAAENACLPYSLIDKTRVPAGPSPTGGATSDSSWYNSYRPVYPPTSTNASVAAATAARTSDDPGGLLPPGAGPVVLDPRDLGPFSSYAPELPGAISLSQPVAEGTQHQSISPAGHPHGLHCGSNDGMRQREFHAVGTRSVNESPQPMNCPLAGSPGGSLSHAMESCVKSEDYTVKSQEVGDSNRGPCGYPHNCLEAGEHQSGGYNDQAVFRPYTQHCRALPISSANNTGRGNDGSVTSCLQAFAPTNAASPNGATNSTCNQAEEMSTTAFTQASARGSDEAGYSRERSPREHVDCAACPWVPECVKEPDEPIVDAVSLETGGDSGASNSTSNCDTSSSEMVQGVLRRKRRRESADEPDNGGLRSPKRTHQDPGNSLQAMVEQAAFFSHDTCPLHEAIDMKSQLAVHSILSSGAVPFRAGMPASGAAVRGSSGLGNVVAPSVSSAASLADVVAAAAAAAAHAEVAYSKAAATQANTCYLPAGITYPFAGCHSSTPPQRSCPGAALAANSACCLTSAEGGGRTCGVAARQPTSGGDLGDSVHHQQSGTMSCQPISSGGTAGSASSTTQGPAAAQLLPSQIA